MAPSLSQISPRTPLNSLTSFAAEELIKNARVQTIIWGPRTLIKVDHIAHLCHENHIPVISFSAISPKMCAFWLEDHIVASGDHDKIGFTLGSDNITFLSPKTNTRNARKLDTRKTKKICKGQTKLKIGVPQKEGFQVFVNVIDPISKKQNITGYSIDIFEAAMRNLHPLPCYKFIVFNGTYDELVGNVSLGVYDGAVGDVTITAERVASTDFTMPYTQSGVSMLVPSEDEPETIRWTFIKPLSGKLWLATMSYTASLSSILTAKRLRPWVTNLEQLRRNGDFVGYQDGSFVRSFLMNHNISESKLRNYKKKEEYATALRKGSMNGGVSAIIDEIPYLTSFLADHRYKNDFKMLGCIYKTPGFGFAFRLSSPLVRNLSTAILHLEGGDEGSQIEEKWFGTTSPPMGVGAVPDADSAPLTLQNFSGLFVITGSISTLMLLISIVRLVCARCIKLGKADVEIISYDFVDDGTLQNVMGNNPNPGQQHIQEASTDDSPGIHESGENDGDVEANQVH
uniref:Glutamate receptor 2.1 n=1 Tax=Aegilops tauschii TaxID=37682 RepID=M8CD88_AEGTA